MRILPGRPHSVFDSGEDPTLQPSPIAHSLPPQNRLGVGFATLTAYGLMAGLALVLPPLLPRQNERIYPPDPLASIKTLDVILREEIPKGPLQKPTRLGSNTQRGGGGNGTIDPALVDKVVPNIPVMIEPPEDLSKVVYPKIPVIAGDPTLPQVMGGNGLERGTGEGVTGRVNGGRRRSMEPFKDSFDRQLIPIHSPMLQYSMSPAEASKNGDRTIVRITIENDGRVSRALAIKGPSFLFAKAEATALQWCFEPLPPHGLAGPMQINISFVSIISSKVHGR